MPGEYNSNRPRRPGSSSGPPGSYHENSGGSYRYNSHRGRSRYGGYRHGYSAEGYDRYRGSSYYNDRREYNGNRERSRYPRPPSITGNDYGPRRGDLYHNSSPNNLNIQSTKRRRTSGIPSNNDEQYDGHARYSRGFAPHPGYRQEPQERQQSISRAIPRGPAQLNQDKLLQSNNTKSLHNSQKEIQMQIEKAKGQETQKIEKPASDDKVERSNSPIKDVDRKQKSSGKSAFPKESSKKGHTFSDVKVKKFNSLSSPKPLEIAKADQKQNVSDRETQSVEFNKQSIDNNTETKKLVSNKDVEKVMIMKIMEGTGVKNENAQKTTGKIPHKITNEEKISQKSVSQIDEYTEGSELKDNSKKPGKNNEESKTVSQETMIDGKQKVEEEEESSKNTTQPDKTILVKKRTIIAKDEDQPISNSRKKQSVVLSDTDESEAETDIEENLPTPSRRTRRLHRLISRANQTDDSSSSERPEQMKRSKSQGTRKVSGRHGRDASGRTLLQRLCARGNFDDAKELIKSGADVNAADYAGNTPLHEAALEGYLEIATLLLDNNADINKQSGQMDRDTPLIDAASNLHYDVVKLFIDRGADPTIANAQGDTALDSLEDEDDELDEDELKISKKLKRLLIHYTKDWRKSHQQERVRSGSAPATEPEDSIAQRRNNNTFFDFFTREGRSEIYTKVSENDVTYVLNYLSNLAGNRVPPDLLTLAARHGHTDIASLLLAFGAKVNYHDNNGRTPLMYAVGRDHMDMVKLLLENGAKITLKDKGGKTALDYAKESDLYDEDEVKLLNGETLEKQVEKSHKNEEAKGKDEEDEKYNTRRETSLTETKKISKREPQKSLKKEPRKKTPTEKEPEVRKEAKIPGNKLSSSLKKERSASPVSKKVESIASHKMVKKSSNKIVSLSSPVETTVPEHRRKSIVENLSGNTISEAISESRSHSSTPVVELSESELRLKKQREEEARVAREKLESERLERKRIRQQQIAKNIEEMEKKRAEEAKTEQLRKRKLEEKEQEESARKRKELEQKELAEKRELEIEKKKLIRSYYPYGVRMAQFGHVPSPEEATKYLPLYVFDIAGIKYVIDVQACLILGVENLFADYPELDKIPVSSEHKSLIWNLLWPMIGSFIKKLDYESVNVQSLIAIYETEYTNFKKMMVHWISYDQFNTLLNRTPALGEVSTLIQSIGICNMKISLQNTNQQITIQSPSVSNEHNSADSYESSFNSSKSGLTAPLQFKAGKVFEMIRRNMW